MWKVFVQKQQKSIPQELIIMQTSLNPHFNQTTHLSFSIPYSVCPQTFKSGSNFNFSVFFFFQEGKSLNFENIFTWLPQYTTVLNQSFLRMHLTFLHQKTFLSTMYVFMPCYFVTGCSAMMIREYHLLVGLVHQQVQSKKGKQQPHTSQ